MLMQTNNDFSNWKNAGASQGEDTLEGLIQQARFLAVPQIEIG